MVPIDSRGYPAHGRLKGAPPAQHTQILRLHNSIGTFDFPKQLEARHNPDSGLVALVGLPTGVQFWISFHYKPGGKITRLDVRLSGTDDLWFASYEPLGLAEEKRS